MRLILHDLPDGLPDSFVNPGDRIIPALGPKAPCCGCFGCWLKTPSSCVLRDRIGNMADYIADCDEILIISKTYIGGLAPDTKNLLDRSIGYILPFMRTLKVSNEDGKEVRECHHTLRYKKTYKMTLIAYGKADFNKEEMNSVTAYIKAVGINFATDEPTVYFVNNLSEVV